MAPVLPLVLATSHFLIKTAAVREEASAPILPQIKSFANGRKCVQIETFPSHVFLPASKPDGRIGPEVLCSGTIETQGSTVDTALIPAAFHLLFCLHVGQRVTPGQVGLKMLPAFLSLSLRLHVGKPARKLLAAAFSEDAAALLK